MSPSVDEPLVAPQSADDVRKLVKDRGIEFLFAQFVDMHGKPNAKLVPAHHLDDMLDEGAGLRRLRGRRHRPGPARPGPDRDARRAQLHAAALAARRGALRLRRHGRGRGVALLPAHHPAPPARARRGAGLRVPDRRRARVLPRAQARGRDDRGRRRARHPRAALLRHARPDAQPRLRLARSRATSPRWAGTTTRPTTRTPTGSSSRTSTSTTPWSPATARSSSATWSRRWRRSAG